MSKLMRLSKTGGVKENATLQGFQNFSAVLLSPKNLTRPLSRAQSPPPISSLGTSGRIAEKREVTSPREETPLRSRGFGMSHSTFKESFRNKYRFDTNSALNGPQGVSPSGGGFRRVGLRSFRIDTDKSNLESQHLNQTGTASIGNDIFDYIQKHVLDHEHIRYLSLGVLHLVRYRNSLDFMREAVKREQGKAPNSTPTRSDTKELGNILYLITSLFKFIDTKFNKIEFMLDIQTFVEILDKFEMIIRHLIIYLKELNAPPAILMSIEGMWKIILLTFDKFLGCQEAMAGDKIKAYITNASKIVDELKTKMTSSQVKENHLHEILMRERVQNTSKQKDLQEKVSTLLQSLNEKKDELEHLKDLYVGDLYMARLLRDGEDLNKFLTKAEEEMTKRDTRVKKLTIELANIARRKNVNPQSIGVQTEMTIMGNPTAQTLQPFSVMSIVKNNYSNLLGQFEHPFEAFYYPKISELHLEGVFPQPRKRDMYLKLLSLLERYHTMKENKTHTLPQIFLHEILTTNDNCVQASYYLSHVVQYLKTLHDSKNPLGTLWFKLFGLGGENMLTPSYAMTISRMAEFLRKRTLRYIETDYEYDDLLELNKGNKSALGMELKNEDAFVDWWRRMEHKQEQTKKKREQNKFLFFQSYSFLFGIVGDPNLYDTSTFVYLVRTKFFEVLDPEKTGTVKLDKFAGKIMEMAKVNLLDPDNYKTILQPFTNEGTGHFDYKKFVTALDTLTAMRSRKMLGMPEVLLALVETAASMERNLYSMRNTNYTTQLVKKGEFIDFNKFVTFLVKENLVDKNNKLAALPFFRHLFFTKTISKVLEEIAGTKSKANDVPSCFVPHDIINAFDTQLRVAKALEPIKYNPTWNTTKETVGRKTKVQQPVPQLPQFVFANPAVLARIMQAKRKFLALIKKKPAETVENSSKVHENSFSNQEDNFMDYDSIDDMNEFQPPDTNKASSNNTSRSGKSPKSTFSRYNPIWR